MKTAAFNHLKLVYSFTIFLLIQFISSCEKQSGSSADFVAKLPENHFILGNWVRQSQTGPLSLNFMENGFVEADMGIDGSAEVTSEYRIRNDTIVFVDRRGGMVCSGTGMYKIYKNEYYISLDMIRDECGGRIKSNMGFWVRPEYKGLLGKLSERISDYGDPEDYLNRARVYLATGKSNLAREDLNVYIRSDSTDSRAFINRAATEMPIDLEAVVMDCNKAIELEPGNKNAYFLRGLALYDLGEKEEACSDFKKAIELGFTVLRYAEQDKCSEFWGPYGE